MKSYYILLVIFLLLSGTSIRIIIRRNKTRKILEELENSLQLAEENFRLENSNDKRLIGKYKGYKVAVGLKSLKERDKLILEVYFPFPVDFQLNGEAETLRKDKATNSLCLGKYAELNSKKWTDVFDELIALTAKT